MNKDEEYVGSVWTQTETGEIGFLIHMHSWSNEEAKWSAAAYFTRTRLEQVRQLREEIALVRGTVFPPGDPTIDIYRRILARLESALATLTQGMKPDVQP